MGQIHARTAVITGAAGGMGRTCARTFGTTANLVLADVSANRLSAFADELRDEGYVVAATVAGDMANGDVLGELVDQIRSSGPLGSLIHTAGVSANEADWKSILLVNAIATRKLLDAVEPVLCEGSVGVMIASMAGHRDFGVPKIKQVAEELEEHQLDAFRPLLDGKGTYSGPLTSTAQIAYSISKRCVIKLVEGRAKAWGLRGARLVSISPGLIYTDMGRAAARNPNIASFIESQPITRWGTAADIAAAAAFLASPQASFITGCDLLVDGGAESIG